LPFVIVATLTLGPLAVLCGLAGQPSAARAAARLWGRVLLGMWGVKVTVRGAAPSGPAVYAANHASALDIPLMFACLPVDFRVLHKRSLYLVPLIGWYLYLAGHIGVDRSNPFRARRSLSRAAARIGSGTSVLVFPEGTRNREALPGVAAFKRGSFVLALEAGVPVVPVSLHGVKALVPHGLLRVRPGAVRVTLHEPVATEGLSAEAAADLAERVRAVVADGCREDAA
jgi:1-acyl-sn-glycerol-3-phosphate acyltransferase